MSLRMIKVTCCSVLITLTGCMAHLTTPYQGPRHCGTTKPPTLEKTLFSCPKAPLHVQQTPIDRNYKDYRASLLHFHSNGENGQPKNEVSATYFQSKLPGQHKLLIVLPIWVGSQYPPRAVTSHIFQHTQGQVNIIRVLAINPLLRLEDLESAKDEKEFRHLLKMLAIRTRNTIIDVQRLVNWAAAQKNTLPQGISVIGFSKASIIAAIATQLNKNISNTILVMGGSDPGELLFHCNYYRIRANITERFHWTDKKLKEVIHTYLPHPYNVAHYPTRLDPSHVLIFDSYYDKCVPRTLRDELWTSMGKPERISFFYGHKLSFGSMTLAGGYYMRYKISDFITNNRSVPK